MPVHRAKGRHEGAKAGKGHSEYVATPQSTATGLLVKILLVSWCFEPSQPQRMTSGPVSDDASDDDGNGDEGDDEHTMPVHRAKEKA